jgi:hypothetical protein
LPQRNLKKSFSFEPDSWTPIVRSNFGAATAAGPFARAAKYSESICKRVVLWLNT